jgi:hypothetical protein
LEKDPAPQSSSLPKQADQAAPAADDDVILERDKTDQSFYLDA